MKSLRDQSFGIWSWTQNTGLNIEVMCIKRFFLYDVGYGLTIAPSSYNCTNGIQLFLVEREIEFHV